MRQSPGVELLIREIHMQKKTSVTLIACMASLAGLLFGFDTGIISGAILFIKQEFQPDTFLIEIIVSAVLFGAFAGSLITGLLSNYFGRRTIILGIAVLFVFGSICSAVAQNVLFLIIGRAIIGLAIGAACYFVPLYISEISPAEHRGRFVAINTIAVTSGIVIAYLVGYVLSYSGSWRWMFGLGAIPGVALWWGMLNLPESPRWFIYKGQTDKAKQVLYKIYPSNEAEKELADMTSDVRQDSVGWKEVFRPIYRRVLVIGLGLAAIQQLSGINAILYYAPFMFEMMGFKSIHTSMAITLGIGIVNLLMTVVAMFTVDRMGRRCLLLLSLPIMALSLSIVGLCVYTGMTNPMIQIAGIGSLLIFVAFYAISIGCIFWIVISEIYPLNIRGIGMSFASSANWMTNLIVSLTYLSISEALGGWVTFEIYASFCALAWIFCYYLLPETSGATLEKFESSVYASS